MPGKLRLVATGDAAAERGGAAADLLTAFAAWREAARDSSAAGRASRALPADRLEAALEAAAEAEAAAESALAEAEAGSLVELAAKLWVAAQQEFDSVALNDALRRDAARIVREAGLLGAEAPGRDGEA